MNDAPDAARPAAPLAAGPRGMKLLSFHREPETAQFADAPVGYALLVLRHGSRVLMVHVRSRSCWELPGGGIEPGETPRAAAVREVWEEAGQRVPPEALHFAGFARTSLHPVDAGPHGVPGDTGRGRILYGAVFTARTDAPQPFTPNSEVSAAHWRHGGEPLPGGGDVQTVDEYLIALCAARP